MWPEFVIINIWSSAQIPYIYLVKHISLMICLETTLYMLTLDLGFLWLKQSLVML